MAGVSSTPAGLRSAKVRGSLDKENGHQQHPQSHGGNASATRSAGGAGTGRGTGTGTGTGMGTGMGTGTGTTGMETTRTGRAGRRESVAREKPASKDGTAQRHAKEVEGLKDYQLGQILGRGAFGSVYCALNWSTGETVAIKQILFSHLPKSELNVIMQEIDLLKNLNHPNIVKYHGFVKSADSLYIILEYCEQGSLHQICKNFGKFPENLVALYIAQVLHGLLFLHEQGVIHRDIKGANILTTKEGLVKLADFGVATHSSPSGQGAADGTVVGTPYWMAPEVIELAGATTASDIWSLGCTVIELLDGKPPYHKFAPMPALFRIVNDDHPPLPEGASPTVRDFLMQCFQKDPNLRVSAKKLLRHPWIAGAVKKGAREKKEEVGVEYDQAVKSVQQWNEALKASPPRSTETSAGAGGSRRSSTKTTSRPASRHAQKPRLSQTPTVRPGSRSSAGGTIGKSVGRSSAVTAALGRPTAPPTPKPAFRLGQRRPLAAQAQETFQSPIDGGRGDNWDSDFESLAAGVDGLGLKIPDHLRPQDHFQGAFSSERLKQYANFDAIPEMDGKVEEWDGEFEGDLTVRSPLEMTRGDGLQTVRPFYPPRTTDEDIRHQPSPMRTRRRSGSNEYDHNIHGRKNSQPKTQILKPAASKTTAPALQQVKLANHATSQNGDRFREEDDEDYSDLVPNDEDAFLKKVAGFSPNRQYRPGDLSSIQTQLGGSLRRRRTHTPTQFVHDAAAMRRTRSSLEIQKYAEDEDDEDFTELVFDDQPSTIHIPSQSPKYAMSMGSESASSGRGTLKLSNSVSWGEDEDDDDDPFAALEEELDEVDLESNVARDKHARLCAVVESLVSDLKLGQHEDVLAEIVEQLLQILAESPDVKSVIVSSHGMLPILEILETTSRPHIIFRLLRIVNIILVDNIEVQENLCFVGGIPIITKFAHKKFASEIRLEAAGFVRMMYQTPTLTLQMFVSCGGLNVLVEFLEEDYDSDAGRELVLVGVNGIWSVFEMQGPTPKNDFCRIFSRSAVLYPLSLVLNRVLDEGDDADGTNEILEGRIVNIFLLFSQAENFVKELVADRMVLKRVLKDLRRMSPQHQITMLKFIKNLSMLATTLDALQNSNAIEVLTDLLQSELNNNTRSGQTTTVFFRDISNQVLNTMYNLCRLSKERQEDAALSGLVPLLQRIVLTERPLKEFALPILCDMAHSGKVGRKVLWQCRGLAFYVGLLADQYWAVTALDAIFIWLQEETAKVEEHLLAGAGTNFAEAMVRCFNESKADAFENLLEPLQKLLRLSPGLAASLGERSVFERSGVKLHSKKALVRLNLLRVVRSICEATELRAGEQGSLLREFGLLDVVQGLAKSDPAILVREMAGDLVRSSEYAERAQAQVGGLAASCQSRSGSSYHGGSGNGGGSSSSLANVGLRRSSSSAMTTPVLLGSAFQPGGIGSASGTPVLERAGSRGYFDLVPAFTAPSSAASARTSPYRNSVTRPGSREGGSAVNWTSSSTGLGRSSSRASLAVTQVGGEGRRPGSRLSLAPTTTMGGERGMERRGSGVGTPTLGSGGVRGSQGQGGQRKRRVGDAVGR